MKGCFFINSKSYPYLDYLRIISSFLVVVIHVSGTFLSQYSVTTYEFMNYSAYDTFARLSVPLFFMISGSLMLQRDYSFKSLLLKALRIFVIFIIFGIVEYFENLISFINSNNTEYLTEFIKGVLSNTTYRWFLLATIGLYLITPILKYISQNNKIQEYLLILLFVFTIILPNIIELGLLNNLITLTNGIGIGISNLSIYIFYYMLGNYILNKSQIISKKHLNLSIFIFVIISLLSVVAFILISIQKGKAYMFMYNWNALNVFLMAVSLYVIALKLFNKEYSFIKKLASCTLGIYLLHVPILKSLLAYGLKTHFIITVPKYTLIIFITSLLIVYILKTITKPIKPLNKVINYIF